MTRQQETSRSHIFAIGLVSVLLILTVPILRIYLGAYSHEVEALYKQHNHSNISGPYLEIDGNPSSTIAQQNNGKPGNGDADDSNAISKKSTKQKMDELLSVESSKLADQDKLDNCFITAITFEFPSLVSTTYQNKREESCDVEAFNIMSIASAKAQLETIRSPFQTGKAGPYRNTATKNLSTSSFPFIYIGNQRYTLSFTVKIGLIDIIRHPQFAFGGSVFSDAIYYPLKARQNLNLFWASGEPAYCLVTPDGRIYLMTHYSTALLPNLDRNNLEVLDKLLILPTGWKYIKVIVSKPIWITENYENGFMVEKLFDNLGNFYIRAELKDSFDYSKDINDKFRN